MTVRPSERGLSLLKAPPLIHPLKIEPFFIDCNFIHSLLYFAAISSSSFKTSSFVI